MKHSICQICGGYESKNGHVLRSVKTKGGVTKFVKIQRVICKQCSKTRRILPKNILPYKHYEREIIEGVLEGLITSDTLGYEDYPCEMTMNRWRSK